MTDGKSMYRSHFNKIVERLKGSEDPKHRYHGEEL